MKSRLRYRGRLGQIVLYLGKFLRIFVYQNDWKILPMAAIISALVVFVVGQNLFVTQEGTATGTFALVCVCIWIGFFNSIQIVCRERDVIKHEHRSGLHMSSYLSAQIILQLLICVLQTGIILLVCRYAGVHIPEEGIIFGKGVVDIGITLFIITFSSDMMSLMISCLVHNTTTAMTLMPFLLIFQLVFSGAYFDLPKAAMGITFLSISKWGVIGLCSIGQYNSQPMVTLWNTLFKFRNIEYMGRKPLLEIIKGMEEENRVNDFLMWSAEYNQNDMYVSDALNVWITWVAMLLLALICVIIAIISLESIDKDKR